MRQGIGIVMLKQVLRQSEARAFNSYVETSFVGDSHRVRQRLRVVVMKHVLREILTK